MAKDPLGGPNEQPVDATTGFDPSARFMRLWNELIGFVQRGDVRNAYQAAKILAYHDEPTKVTPTGLMQRNGASEISCAITAELGGLVERRSALANWESLTQNVSSTLGDEGLKVLAFHVLDVIECGFSPAPKLRAVLIDFIVTHDANWLSADEEAADEDALFPSVIDYINQMTLLDPVETYLVEAELFPQLTGLPRVTLAA